MSSSTPERKTPVVPMTRVMRERVLRGQPVFRQEDPYAQRGGKPGGIFQHHRLQGEQKGASVEVEHTGAALGGLARRYAPARNGRPVRAGVDEAVDRHPLRWPPGVHLGMLPAANQLPAQCFPGAPVVPRRRRRRQRRIIGIRAWNDPVHGTFLPKQDVNQSIPQRVSRRKTSCSSVFLKEGGNEGG